jgi:hypothetical protein
MRAFGEGANAVRQMVLVGATPSQPAPPEVTDWRSVTLTGGAIAVTVAAFFLAIRSAGRAAR